MEKIYKLSDGRIKRIPVDDESAFLAELKEKNLTAELTSANKIVTENFDQPGKHQGTSLSQNNQQKNTGFKSEDGSSDSSKDYTPKQYKVGDNTFTVNSKEEEKDLLKTHKSAKLVKSEGFVSKAWSAYKNITGGAISVYKKTQLGGSVSGLVEGVNQVFGKDRVASATDKAIAATVDLLTKDDLEGDTFDHQLPEGFQHEDNKAFEDAASSQYGFRQEENLTKWFNEKSKYKDTNVRMVQSKKGKESVEILIGKQQRGQGKVFDLTKGYGATRSEGFVKGAFTRADGVFDGIKMYIDQATNKSYDDEVKSYIKNRISNEDLALDPTNENIAKFMTDIELSESNMAKYGVDNLDDLKEAMFKEKKLIKVTGPNEKEYHISPDYFDGDKGLSVSSLGEGGGIGRYINGKDSREINAEDLAYMEALSLGEKTYVDADGNRVTTPDFQNTPKYAGELPPPPYERLDRKWYMEDMTGIFSTFPKAFGVDEYNVDMSGTVKVPDGKGGMRDVPLKYLWDIRKEVLTEKLQDSNVKEYEVKRTKHGGNDGIDKHVEEYVGMYFGFEDQKILDINKRIEGIIDGSIDVNEEEVELEKLRAEKNKIIKEKGYDKLYDEQGKFIGINKGKWIEDEKDPNYLVNAKTGERIPNIDVEAEPLAYDNDLDWLKAKRRDAYIKLITMAKLAYQSSLGIDQQTNQLIKGFGDIFDPNNDSLNNDLRQLALVAETGDIFHLMGEDGMDLPFLTDLPGKSQVAREFNEALLDFKTLSRAVDLNINLATTKKDGYFKKAFNDLSKSFVGAALPEININTISSKFGMGKIPIINEYGSDNVDSDDYYDAFKTHLMLGDYEVEEPSLPERTAKWYEFKKGHEENMEEWSSRGNNNRDIMDLASGTITGLGPLIVELRLLGASGVSKAITTRTARMFAGAENLAARNFPKLAERFSRINKSPIYRDIIRKGTIAGTATAAQWSVAETVGKNTMGWDAQTVNYDPETGEIETRLAFPFAMGFAGVATQKVNQAMYDEFLKGTYGATFAKYLNIAKTKAPVTTNVVGGGVSAVQGGAVATGLLTVSEAAQLVSNDIANGYWPGSWPPQNSPEGQARLKEWKHLTDRDHLISMWIAMTVLPVAEGKIPKQVKQNIKRDIMALKDNTKLSKEATDGLGIEKKYEMDPDNTWKPKHINKTVHDRIVEIKKDKTLSKKEMIEKIKQAEQWGRELHSRNSVIEAKKGAIKDGTYNEYLRDQFLLANKIPTGNLTGDELVRLSEMRHHELDMFLRNENIAKGSSAEAYYKQVHNTMWVKNLEGRKRGMKGREFSEYMSKQYQLAKNLGAIESAKNAIKENPEQEDVLKGEIKKTKEVNKVLETKIEEAEKKAEEQFKKDKKNQNAADKKGAEKLDKKYEEIDDTTRKGKEEWEKIAKKEKADPKAEAFFSADGKRIYISKSRTNKRKTIGAGTHELGHAIVYDHLKETIKDPKTGKERRVISEDGIKIIDLMLSKLSGRERRLLKEIVEPVHNPDGKTNKREYYEEYVTTLAHEIKDGNIKKRVELGRNLGRTLFPFLNKVWPSLYKFDLNQTNSKKAAKDLLSMVETLGTEGITPEIVELANAQKIKPSKELIREVQSSTRIFEKKRDGVIDVVNKMEQGAKTKEEFQNRKIFNPIYESIVKQNGAINNYIRSLGMSWEKTEATIDKVGDRLMNYDPQAKRKGDIKEKITVGEFIMSNIGFGKLEAAKKLFEEGEIRKKTDRIDQQREDGKQKEYGYEDPSEPVVSVESTQKTSRLRKSLGLKKDMMNVVRKSVIETIGKNQTAKGSVLPGVETEQFRNELTKSFRDILKKPIQDMMGIGENYNRFLKDHFEGVYDNIPVETLVQMERNVKPENRIFTTSKRITKSLEVDRLVGKEKLSKNQPKTGRTMGPNLHTKKPFPGIEKVLAFYRGVDMMNQLGYEIGGSTLGTRKDKLAMEIGVELAFDATMEVVQRPEVATERSRIMKEMWEVEQLANEMSVISKQINRDPNVKFSKREEVNEAFDKAMKIDGVTKGEIIDVFANKDIEWIKDNMPLTYDALRVSYESKYGPQEYKNKNFTDQVAEFGVELKEIIDAKSYQTTGSKGGKKWWNTKLINGMMTHFSGATKKPSVANMLDFMPTEYGGWETQMRLNRKGGYKFAENDLLKGNSSDRGNALELVNGKPVYKRVEKLFRDRLEKGDMGKFLARYPELQKKWDMAMKAIKDLQLAESTIKYEGTLTKELTELMRNENLGQKQKLALAKKKFNPKSVDAAFKLYDAYMSSHQAWFNHKVNVEKMPKKEAINYVITSLQSNSNFTKGLRALAPVTAVYFPAGKKGGVMLHLKGEHIIDSATFSAKLVDAIYNNTFNQNSKSLYRNFNQALIPSKFANQMDKLGGANSPLGNRRFLLMPEFGKQVFDLASGKSMYELELAEFTKETSLMLKDAWINSKKTVTHRKAGETIGTYAKNSKRKGMSTFDFDDTLASTKSGVRTTIPNPSFTPKPGRKVVFLAGGAGSGKSNVVKKLGLEKDGFKIVNQDISLEWLKKNHGLPESMKELTKEQRSTLGKLGHQARGIAKRKMMKFQGKGDGVVVDGTGASKKNMEKLVGEFKDKGYDVSMMFVETSLETAMARNKARKERSLLDVIVRKNHESVMGNKETYKEMFGETFMEVKTDKLTMESSMPTNLISKMNNFVRSYEKVRLDAEEFASKGEEIISKGGKFDFSEFNKVVEGTEGPYLQKAIDRAKKFGTKDLFVLTARPKESAKAIQEFLKSQGLDIPIENITGLANSSGNAKAMWMIEKFAEGYNDMYFVDDALQNVDAVKKVLEQLDIKSKVVQAKVEAKSSKRIDAEFNKILERASEIKAGRKVSESEAQLIGRGKGRNLGDMIMPPSAQDLRGLMTRLYGRGKQGDADMAFIKKSLFDPFAKGIRDLTIVKQKMAEEYKSLRKQSKDVRKSLNKNIEGTPYTVDHALRMYLWDKAGHKVEGITEAQRQRLVDYVKNKPELLTFAETLQGITRFEKYLEPGEYWAVENIASDLNTLTRGGLRKQHLKEWMEAKDVIFSKDNLNKLEAIYGEGYRQALEGMLHRMETGTNRLIGTKDGPVKTFYDWVNGSVGATMFWNTRSAILQTISTVNFINHKENNIFRAAQSFANQPQYWKDFSFIFNSPMLKQRRSGLEIDVSASELTNQFQKSGKNPKAILNYMLQQGFTPTRMADSFAIALGGASYYRNRIRKHMKEGLSEAKAKEKAWLEFQELAEETQQSSRPDLISQQQAGPLGRIILAWQNTPMQMTRLMHKSLSNLVNNRGSKRENISRIIYYGAVQNLWFMALQSGLGWLMFGDDQEEAIQKKELRVVNGAFDTLIRGTGIYGGMFATLKNTILSYQAERKKGWNKDLGNVAVESIQLSPPIGSKVRKLYSAVKTWEYNQGVGKEIGFRIENPNLHATSNVVEALTNIPMARTVNKMNNLEEVMTGNHEPWQRAAMALGWSRWNVGAKDEELEEAKEKAKETRKENKEKQKKEDLKSGKVVRCSATKSNGQRCNLTTNTGKKGWKCMHHASKRWYG